jgi:hypothetical protein
MKTRGGASVIDASSPYLQQRCLVKPYNAMRRVLLQREGTEIRRKAVVALWPMISIGASDAVPVIFPVSGHKFPVRLGCTLLVRQKNGDR